MSNTILIINLVLQVIIFVSFLYTILIFSRERKNIKMAINGFMSVAMGLKDNG